MADTKERVEDYVVVIETCSHYDKDNFIKNVKKYINDGFEPLGKMSYNLQYSKCVQTLIKRSKDENKSKQLVYRDLGRIGIMEHE
jgi:hypothetical protein